MSFQNIFTRAKENIISKALKELSTSNMKHVTKKVTKKASVKKIPKKITSKTVKKTVKKVAKVAKKIPTKKTTTKATSKKQVRALVCAPGKHCFWTKDGQVLEDLNQLQIAFGSMDDEVFLHHVTKGKNDFADWVEHVLLDSECALGLRKSRKASSSRTVVIKCLRGYAL